MFALRLVFVAQLLVMFTGFVVLLVTPADFQTVALLFYLVILGSVAALYAAWQFIKHPARRALASAVIATPIFCIATPFLITGPNGGPVSPVPLIVSALVFIVVTVCVLLSKKSRWQTNGTFSDKRFNSKIVIALVILLVLYLTPIVTWLYMQESFKLPNDISSRDEVLRAGTIYFVTVAGPALLLSLFTLLYAPVGLVRNQGSRLVHAGQLVLALTTLASLAVGTVAVAIFSFNPG